MKHRILAVPALTLAVLGAPSVLGTPTAAADPSGCVVQHNVDPGKARPTAAWSYCSTYRGKHRVGAKCDDADRKHTTQYGPWVGADQRSTVRCYEVNRIWNEIQ